MKLKNVLLTGLSFVLVAAIAVGGTFAYLQDDDSDVNVMTLGNVKIEQHEYERVQNADGTYATDTIDNQTSYVLKDFTQGKPLLPATALDANGNPYNYGAGDWDSTVVRMTQVDSYGSMQVFTSKNAQDKFVTVENTGKTDAYVRTLVAIEIGTGDASLIGTSHHSTWTKNNIGVITVDEINYFLAEYVYNGGQLSDGSWRHGNGILPAGKTSYPSLSQVYLKAEATNEDCEALDGNKNGTLDILVMSQAVQAAGFADAETALNAGFGDITTTDHPWAGAGNAPSFNAPENDAELEEALKDENAKQIIVNLTGDVTYDVAAWAKDAMGGENTEFIMINGNGHTITFNQTNSDWNNIVTNGAKLIINNAKITNAGHNDGPWNRHDLNFACEVELNNVVSDKALAFKAGATLNNVTINDANTSDTYAIWIQPNGQTVTLNGCTIDMLDCIDGRGIKIDEQYVSNPEKVTLNVSNTTFKTEEKSAILVKSKAGADINLNNVDIYGVVADPINHVWVDEASAAYADLVTVTGGKKIVEGDKAYTVVNSADELWGAVANGKKDIVVMNADINIVGERSANDANITFMGGTFTTNNANYIGIVHCGEMTYNDVTFNGGIFLYGEKEIFNNCTFNLTTNYVWTYGAKEVEFNNCTFNTDGKAILFYQEASNDNKVLNVKDCIFNATKTAQTWDGTNIAAVSIDGSLPNGGTGTFTVNFEGDNSVDSDFNGLWQIKAQKSNVTVND